MLLSVIGGVGLGCDFTVIIKIGDVKLIKILLLILLLKIQFFFFPFLNNPLFTMELDLTNYPYLTSQLFK